MWVRTGVYRFLDAAVFEVGEHEAIFVLDSLAIGRRNVIFRIRFEPRRDNHASGSREKKIVQIGRNSRRGVAGSGDLRLVRCRNLPVPELLPVHLTEPRVCEHVARAVLQVAVALRRVMLKEFEDKVRRVRIE